MTQTNSNPLVSVIMPVHNRFQYADEAIKSVFDQDYRPIELIIVDDFSDQPYYPSHQPELGVSLTQIRHHENLGPGASRESGRMVASGEYLTYLDSDDLWDRNKIRKQVTALHNNPNSGMCYCQSVSFSNVPEKDKQYIRKRSDKFFASFLPFVLDGRPWDTSSCMWTRNASDQIGPWFSGWTWEDYEYDTRAGCHNISICYIPEILCFYRLDQEDEKLSNIGRERRLIFQTASMKEMQKNLKSFGKLSEVETRSKLSKRLFRQSMNLYFAGKKSEATELLKMVHEIEGGSNKLLCRFIITINHFMTPRLSGHLLYQLRNTFESNTNKTLNNIL